jgi:hypothetical protein
MIVPDQLSQVETRGEWVVCYIRRVLEPDGIQDGLFILRVMKWGIHRHSVSLTLWQAMFLGLPGRFEIIKDVGRLSLYAHPC